MNKEEYKKPLWLWIIIISYALWCVIDYGLDGILIAGISLAIGLGCGKKCTELAGRIKSNKSVAFLVGYCLNLLGLLSYYIYYRFKI